SVARASLEATRELGDRERRRVAGEHVDVVGRVADGEHDGADVACDVGKNPGEPRVCSFGEDRLPPMGGPDEMDEEARRRVTLTTMRRHGLSSTGPRSQLRRSRK